MERIQFLLEIGGFCCLCLKKDKEEAKTAEDDDDEEPSPPPAEPEIVSFQRITKYLRMDMKSVFANSEIISGPISSVQMTLEQSELNGVLCKECAQITGNISELYTKFEMIRMQLESCLINLKGRMTNAEKEEQALKDFQLEKAATNKKKKKGPQESIHYGIVDRLRKEMIKKCIRKLAECPPRVLLKKKSNKKEKEKSKSKDKDPANSKKPRPRSKKSGNNDAPNNAADKPSKSPRRRPKPGPKSKTLPASVMANVFEQMSMSMTVPTPSAAADYYDSHSAAESSASASSLTYPPFGFPMMFTQELIEGDGEVEFEGGEGYYEGGGDDGVDPSSFLSNGECNFQEEDVILQDFLQMSSSSSAAAAEIEVVEERDPLGEAEWGNEDDPSVPIPIPVYHHPEWSPYPPNSEVPKTKTKRDKTETKITARKSTAPAPDNRKQLRQRPSASVSPTKPKADDSNSTKPKRPGPASMVKMTPGRKVYKCEICSAQFRKKAELKKHQSSNLCNAQKAKARKLLLQTRKIKKNQSNKVGNKSFECEICYRVFSRSSQLKDHVDFVHIGIKLECESCHELFGDRERYNLHRKTCRQ